MHFRNEIIWKRTTAHSSAKRYAPVHDVLLYYTKAQKPIWNTPRGPYEEGYLDKYYRFDDGDGRLYWRDNLCAAGVRKGSSGKPWRGFDPAKKGMHWKFTVERLDELDAAGRIYWPSGGTGWPQYKRYRDELKGKAVPDLWTDIDRINPVGSERIGYPTQKPLALLERIIQASSNEGGMVLDPFCGCGTTITAAEELGRSWIGIDITYLAIDIMKRRLEHAYGEDAKHLYWEDGIPRDLPSAKALFKRNALDFERWAVSLVNGTPNEKQVGDRGMDGVIRFFTDTRGGIGRALVSVKGGKSVGPAEVRDLLGTVETQRAEMGVLVTMEQPTRGMKDAADHAGAYRWPLNDDLFPKIQLVTIRELLDGKRPQTPTTLTPYIPADRLPRPSAQTAMDIPTPVAPVKSRRR